MALPNGVSVPTPLVGHTEFVTQRGYFAPPYVSCMFAALGSVLIWMGYSIPLERKASLIPPENFVWTLHKNSGAPLDSGSSIRHTKNALGRLLPDAPVLYGSGTPSEIIDLLEDDAAVRVTARCWKLPTYLRRHVGDFTGGHAFSMIGTKVEGGVRKVFWMDPMAKPWEYAGEWIPWSDVSDDLDRNADDEIVATWGYKNTAVDPTVIVDPEDPIDPEPDPEPDPIDEDVPPPVEIPDPPPSEEDPETGLSGILDYQRGTVAAGTPAYHPQTLAHLFTFQDERTVRVYGLTADSVYRGVVSRTSGTDGNDPKVVLVQADSISNIHIDTP